MGIAGAQVRDPGMITPSACRRYSSRTIRAIVAVPAEPARTK